MPRPVARLLSLSIAILFSLGVGAPALAATVAWLEMKGAVAERAPEMAFMSGAQGMTLLGVASEIRKAADDPEVKAIVLRFSDLNAGMAQIHEIGRAVEYAKSKRKKVHAFTEIYGPVELLLASFCDDVIVQKGGAVMFPGLYMEEMFLADTLAWVGAKADFVQIGDYKGASEQLANNAPSKAWEQNITQLLDSMWGAMQARLTTGRGMSKSQLDDALRAAWLGDPEDARKAGLVDAVLDRLEVHQRLVSMHGEDLAYRVVDFSKNASSPLASSNPFAIFELLSARPKTKATRDTIAVLHIDGPIVDGESQPASILGGSSVGSLTIRKALKQIEDDPNIKGVVVRIDSPGGSAIASESMWIGMRRVASTKPVWVSIGDMAASGGYYCAVAGDRIYLEPTSIVGSIGVVGGKIVLGGVYDKAQVRIVPRGRGPLADMMSTVSPWNAQQRELVRSTMQNIYDQFVDRVKTGRKNIDIARTAEGRLFVGQDAIDLRMADELGGLTDAIGAMASKLSLRDGAYDIMDFPTPRSLDEILGDLFGRFGVAAPGAQAAHQAGAFAELARQIVGDRAWEQLRGSMTALMQMRDEPVLLVNPRVLIFR